MTANQPLSDAIVIGIDFGTTFSGVAWAYSREPDEIEIVTSWDAELNHSSDIEKVPTQLYFDDNGQDVKWGYSIPIDNEPLKWFKLLLIDLKDLPTDVARSSQLQEARRLRNKIKKEPIEIIATFLRKLWDHSLDSIRRAVGVDLLKRTKLQVVITLPAIWPPYAQQRMKRAAQQSGILDGRPAGATTLRFISEPEAAALATIKDLAKRSNIKDLISYIFESTDPFVIKECVKGDGDLCGGVFLDEGFIKLVRKKSPSGTWGPVSHSDEKKFLNDQWEHGIKLQFENQKRTWPVDLPESCGRNSSQGLRRRITIDLTSWTSICRGAVVQGLLQHNPSSGLGVNVEARIARMSYGINFQTPFVWGKHDVRDKVWDDREQQFKAQNQMEWFLKEVRVQQ
ncbi:Hsp70 chaperone protein [Fusarium acuminatum]|uniref:Hsp70 chaperone protein n=1 Tax=Fusarium acuminatum TaxID=5515 RepID=A0ABZ2WJW5_9HYPO